MAQLGTALASYGDPVRADAMFTRASKALDAQMGIDQEQIYRTDFGTILRDTAAVLALAIESGTQVIDTEALINRIATTKTLSTQEAVWTLLAANALISTATEASIMIDGMPASGPLVRTFDANQTTPILVENLGADTTLTLTTHGVPARPDPDGGAGYAITRSYYTLDGAPMTLDAIKVGQRFVTVLDIIPYGRGEARLMVNDPLPAGFEIDNPNLISAGSVADLDFLNLEAAVTHAEFRQDRFLAALDRNSAAPFRLGYILRAISPGIFHLPAASVEDMYRPDFSGVSESGTVQIQE
jgi:uncharacterized protein YfaS (alpha-2-macroglobulin family)